MRDTAWKWAEKVSVIVGIVSFIKGEWKPMESLSSFWGGLTAWRFLFYLAITIIVIKHIRDYLRLKRWVFKTTDSNNFDTLEGKITQIATDRAEAHVKALERRIEDGNVKIRKNDTEQTG